MLSPKTNNKVLNLVLTSAFLAVLFGCASKFPSQSEPPRPSNGDGALTATVQLKPDPISISMNTAFSCSLQVAQAPGLLAARFLLHFNSTFINYQQANAFDSTPIPFFNVAVTQTDTLAKLSVIIASSNTLPNNAPLCVLQFKTLQRAGIDSIYFATSTALTPLRDTLNQAIAIGRFQSVKVTIKN